MFRIITTIILLAVSVCPAIAQRDAVYLNEELAPISQSKAKYYRTHERNGELFDVHVFYIGGAKYMDVTCKSIEPLVKHGKYVSYDPSGRKIGEGNYAEDKYDGRCVDYFGPSGRPKRVVKYENGMLNGSITQFDSI